MTLEQFIESEIQKCRDIAAASAEWGYTQSIEHQEQKISLLNQVLETMAPAQELIENFIDARVEKIIEERVEDIVDCKLDNQLENMVREIMEANNG